LVRVVKKAVVDKPREWGKKKCAPVWPERGGVLGPKVVFRQT